MSDFQYKEVDSQGLETLDVISQADKFNYWMYSSILPYCKGEILEIGSGIGNISQCFLNEGHSITVSDIRDNYCQILKDKFKSFDNLQSVCTIDIAHPNFEEVYSDHLGKFDTVFALNIIEHIENDSVAIINCKKMLKSNGSLLILVPAYQFLYNNFDKELQHFRRYNRKGIKSLLEKNGFMVRKSFYFNAVGTLGWFITGTIMRKKIIPGGQMSLYNKLVPLFKIIDRILFRSYGLSVVTIGSNN